MQKKPSYEEAMSRLEEIVQNMEDGNLDLDTLTLQLREAKSLIKICKDKLTKTDAEINEILKEDSQHHSSSKE
ncbi:MAG: exodeoxyribonuclease VII small subunit [Prevotella sp.]|jgi:exodeoxyribonuclease VII small subunit|nr:exodeoxyribonuclease VII small subunit [Prevotella sp.]